MNTTRTSGRRSAGEFPQEVTGEVPWSAEHPQQHAGATVERPGRGGQTHPGTLYDDSSGDSSGESFGDSNGDSNDGEGLRVGLQTEDSALRHLVSGICASAGATLKVSVAGAAVGAVDVQLYDVRSLATAGIRDDAGGEVVLLGRPEDSGLWDAAALLGGCPVAVLPEAEAWLADRLSPRAQESAGGPGVVVGVAGAAGGVGTSTLACWLAADAADNGARTVLVDADPDGCGLDVLLGLEAVDALRWPDLCRSNGVLRAEQLWPLLPGHVDHDDLRWLSWDRAPHPPVQVPWLPVLAALRTAAHAVVVDLGRVTAGDTALATHCDVVLLTLPRTVRGVLAAHRATELLAPARVECVLCGVDVADVDDALVTEALGREPVGHIRFDGRVPEAAETGRLLDRGGKRSHAQSVSQIWDELTNVLSPVSGGTRGGGF